ncbi:MAG: metallophosphoesterase [Lachnospiraceae bacterium]|nr:metallophosphoesterase [Lachnospiraceae bacterium]
MWLIIFAVSILAGIAAILYLSEKIRTSGLLSGIGNAASARVISVLVVVALAVIICLVFDVTNAIVIFVHLAVFELLADIIRIIFRKLSPWDIDPRIYSIAALALCVIYLCIGWHMMHGLWETDYKVSSDKECGNIRVALIADSHVGTGFSGKEFADHLKKIEEAKPDLLVIAGDFVDDSTKLSDMKDACAALSSVKLPYGIYYCFGNHDRGYYSNERRGYDGDGLAAELSRSGVTVLKDQSVLVDGRFYVIGREDAGYGNSDRMSAAELMAPLDKDKYTIMLDHQPVDYDLEAAAGLDLVLSGHTHGGQLWPLEYIQPLISENDNVRGYERRGGTDFIVTDGISDWAVKFKTGCRSEFCIIDISGR